MRGFFRNQRREIVQRRTSGVVNVQFQAQSAKGINYAGANGGEGLFFCMSVFPTPDMDPDQEVLW